MSLRSVVLFTLTALLGNNAFAGCSPDETQEVPSKDLATPFNLRNEANIRAADYKKHLIPKCPVLFDVGVGDSVGQDKCVHDSVLAFAQLSAVVDTSGNPTSAVLKILSAGELRLQNLPLMAYDEAGKSVQDGVAAFLKAEDVVLGGKHYNLYAFLAQDPVAMTLNVRKTYRLEVFDLSDAQCLPYLPEKKIWSKLDPPISLVKSSGSVHVNETQVGDGSEPKH